MIQRSVHSIAALVLGFLLTATFAGCGDDISRTQSTSNELTTFGFRKANNPSLGADVAATINGDAIAATVPFGTDVKALVAAFTTTGVSVTVGGTAQTSGASADDFSAPVTYVVTAEDGTTRSYTVTVTVASSSAKAITSYQFLASRNSGLGAGVTATINGDAIAATVPFGTSVAALVASFATTGASVTVGATAQVSGTTANDFTSPVVYRVTAADGTTHDYTVTVIVAASTAKEITTYAFLSANNAGKLAVDVTALINGTAIAATVPFGTDVTALVADFATTGTSVTVGGTAQVSGVTANDFTGPVAYTVTAADSSTKVFTVTVTIAASPAKEITTYAFHSADNPGLGADVAATINGNSIAATVQFGTNVTALIATYATTGASVKVGTTSQTSGITANDFTNPVVYTVTAADGTTQDFTVTLTIAPSKAKEITDYAFLSANNAGLGADVTATINGSSIAATVPFGTTVTALIATFTSTGASVTVGGVSQASGITANDFTGPVSYHVTAADGSTQDFQVTVTIAANPAKEITDYAFLSANNAGLGADVTATINGNSIAATVPFGTNVTALIATFATTGASVKVGNVEQSSGITANDFSAPVTYHVTAADGSTRDFTVTVTVAVNSSAAITAYAFLSANNAGLGADVTATINGRSIAVTVPFGTIVTGLVATFATTGTSVAVGATTQVSDATANDFTNPVDYTVTAADLSTQVFTVTVTIAPSPARDITTYAFLSANNGGLVADVIATINGTSISATVPFGTNVTALIATFATTGASVKVGGVTQSSGITANDFTAPVTYHVTAADGSTRDFTVTVTIAPSPAKEITTYAFLSANNPGLGADVTATINGSSISATVPFGTDVTALVATFASTGASVKVGGVEQASGITANNFTAAVTYHVTAADTSTRDFSVTVTIAPSPAKDITAYQFLSAHNGGLGADVVATINGTAISATVPFGTNVTALVATFATTGASVAVGGTLQVSDATANDFTNPVDYTVTAADLSTQIFTVTVTVAPSPAKDLTAFAFLSAHNPSLVADVAATINGTAITATVPFGTNVAALVATFATTGASVAVGATPQVSNTTANDFTAPVVYTVTAADGTTEDFTVTVAVAPSSGKDLTTYKFLSAGNSGLSGDVTATINGSSISAVVAFGTTPATIAGLKATFTSTGASVAVAGTPQVSGATVNDFTNPVAYTVTAADGSTRSYTVTVTIATNPAASLTAFSFTKVKNPALVMDFAATITGTSVLVDVPPGTDVSALIATFTVPTGAAVTIGLTSQVSGTTVNNFTNPLTYTVTKAGVATLSFTVAVNVTEVSFSFTGAKGNEASFPGDGANPKLNALPAMTRGPGLTPTTTNNVFTATAWTLALAPDLANDYYSFTVTPASGVAMTLTRLALKDQASGTGPKTFAIRSSVDGFAADLQTFVTHTAIARSDLALDAAFAGLTTAVEFRLYAYGASSLGGTWRIDDVELSGSTTP